MDQHEKIFLAGEVISCTHFASQLRFEIAVGTAPKGCDRPTRDVCVWLVDKSGRKHHQAFREELGYTKPGCAPKPGSKAEKIPTRLDSNGIGTGIFVRIEISHADGRPGRCVFHAAEGEGNITRTVKKGTYEYIPDAPFDKKNQRSRNSYKMLDVEEDE